MTIFRRMLFEAARRVAMDPRVQEMAAEVVEREIKPRARAAWRQAKPRVAAARDELRRAGDEVRDAARTTDPRERPAEFARELKRRFVDREGRN